MAEEMMEQEQGQEQEQKVDPKIEKEIQVFVGGISKMLHGKETKGKVYETLKSAPPEMSIPEVSWQLSNRVFEATKEKGKTPSLEALISGVVFSTSELIEIGNAGGFFEKELGEEDLQPIVQASLQKAIESGVRSKIIDPIEVQQKIEPLLSDQQRQMGLEAAQRTGVPQEAGLNQAMEKYASERVDKDRQMTAAKAAAKQKQGMLQQAQGGQ